MSLPLPHFLNNQTNNHHHSENQSQPQSKHQPRHHATTTKNHHATNLATIPRHPQQEPNPETGHHAATTKPTKRRSLCQSPRRSPPHWPPCHHANLNPTTNLATTPVSTFRLRLHCYIERTRENERELDVEEANKMRESWETERQGGRQLEVRE